MKMLFLRQQWPVVTLRSIGVRCSRSYSKDYASSSDDEKETKPSTKSKPKPTDTTNKQEDTAATKLNRLLASMSTDDPYNLAKSNETSNNMARPGTASKKRRENLKAEIANKDVFTAVKRVASMLGDQQQQKQTESELLAKLLGHTEEEAPSKQQTKQGNETNEGDLSLSELIVGMKIDRKPPPTRGEYVRKTLAATRTQQQPNATDGKQYKPRQPRSRTAETFTGSVNLFGAEPLGIFKSPIEFKDSHDILSTWAHLQEREIKLQVEHPPANYFEKIARWTEEGKVWRFPIDNEQDWAKDEVNVDFSEHIFLDQHLEPWCPTKGPIRHFMELVCIGLSKNPYVTAQEKKEHILWYRDYFEGKREMLKEYMKEQKEEKPKKLTAKSS